jgi:hypothetical protein
MYCPLLRMMAGQKGECLKEKCAWWFEAFDKKRSGCAIGWIANLLDK